jgi:hypothetical protein
VTAPERAPNSPHIARGPLLATSRTTLEDRWFVSFSQAGFTELGEADGH